MWLKSLFKVLLPPGRLCTIPGTTVASRADEHAPGVRVCNMMGDTPGEAWTCAVRTR